MRQLGVVLSVALWLIAAPAASASSLVYLSGASGAQNVSVARPDGTGAKPLTNGQSFGAFATTGGDLVYVFTGQSNGTSSFFAVDQQGTLKQGPFLFLTPSCSTAPFGAAAQSDGALLATTYFHNPTGAICSGSLNLRTKIIAGTTITASPDGLRYHPDVKSPRFLRAPDNRLLALTNSGDVQLWRSTDQSVLETWLPNPTAGDDVDSVDVDETTGRLIVEVSKSGNPAGGETKGFFLYSYTGAPNAATPPSPICSLDLAFRDGFARPRFSPDGTEISWAGAEGIYTSPAPQLKAGTGTPGDPLSPDCTLTPKLVIPGGTEADWATFDVTTPPAPAGGGGGGTTGGATTPGGNGATSSPAIVLKAPTKPATSAFARGLDLTVTAGSAGAITATATVSKGDAKKIGLSKKPKGPVTVAQGSATAKAAGAVKVKLKPTKAAKSRAKKFKNVTLTITVKLGDQVVVQKVKLGQK